MIGRRRRNEYGENKRYLKVKSMNIATYKTIYNVSNQCFMQPIQSSDRASLKSSIRSFWSWSFSGHFRFGAQTAPMRVCHKSMAHPLLCYLLHNPRSIVAYSKKGIILYRLQILLFPIFSIINRQEVHKRA